MQKNDEKVMLKIKWENMLILEKYKKKTREFHGFLKVKTEENLSSFL